jgi:hypothetical protein
MYKTLSAFLTLALFALSSLQALSAEVDTAQRSTTPVKAEIDTLPPVGKGHDMVKPYQQKVSVPARGGQDSRGEVSRDRVNTPYSREIVPPSYRYGTPGYMPDGRGGRGYDFGYPGYREQGGGGYPHQRGFGNSRGFR